jgi:hypothetical protein
LFNRGLVMEEFTPPPTVYDTYIPGLLSSQAATVVGAVRAASFEVVPGADETFTLRLRHYWPPDEDGPSAQRQADGLREYVIPNLVDGRDRVVEIRGRRGLVFRQYVLLLMVKDQQQRIRGVGALMVECPHKKEAERRLMKLKEMSVG